MTPVTYSRIQARRVTQCDLIRQFGDTTRDTKKVLRWVVPHGEMSKSRWRKPRFVATFPLCVGAVVALEHRYASRLAALPQGALAPVRALLSRSIITYSAPSAPLAGTFPLHRLAACYIDEHFYIRSIAINVLG